MTQLKIIDAEQSKRPAFRVYFGKKSPDNKDVGDYEITFQFKHNYAEYKEPSESLHAADYPIQVLRINQGEPMCCDAVLRAFPMKRCGYIVSHIILNNELYRSAFHFEYWFPLVGKPSGLEDGTVQLYCGGDNRAHLSVLLNMDNEGIPFMDLSGTFHIKGKIVATEVKSDVFVNCKKDVTVFSSGGKVTSYLDHETHLLHSVKNETTFYEMECANRQ